MQPSIYSAALTALVIGAVTLLVAIDKLSADLALGVVFGPIVAWLVHAAGVRAGSKATVDPPPDS